MVKNNVIFRCFKPVRKLVNPTVYLWPSYELYSMNNLDVEKLPSTMWVAKQSNQKEHSRCDKRKTGTCPPLRQIKMKLNKRGNNHNRCGSSNSNSSSKLIPRGRSWPGALPLPARMSPTLTAAPGHSTTKTFIDTGGPTDMRDRRGIRHRACAPSPLPLMLPGQPTSLSGGEVWKDGLRLWYLCLHQPSPGETDVRVFTQQNLRNSATLFQALGNRSDFLKRSLPSWSLYSNGIFQNKGVCTSKAGCEGESTPGRKAKLFH